MSNKKVYFRQCRLRKPHKDGSWSEQVSYIPEPYCVKDRVLKLRGSNDAWENGWIVESASSEKYPMEEVPDGYNLIKGHRKATGDSLPK